MSYWFFLSYARIDAKFGKDPDGKAYIERFYRDLAGELARKVSTDTEVEPEQIAFFDQRSVGAGDTSMETVTAALQQSRILVCVYSLAYFKKPYCGKEFEYFRRRLAMWRAQHPRAGTPPTAIIPIYWDPHAQVYEVVKTLPAAVSSVEIAGPEFNKLYGDIGLNVLSRQKSTYNDVYKCSYGDAYDSFVMSLAQYIYEKGKEAEAAPLPQLDNSSSIESMNEPFPVAPLPGATSQGAAALLKGPEYAKFFYVAASQGELAPDDSRLQAYGSGGGLEWRPYYPAEPSKISALAQVVTGQRDITLRYEEQLDATIAEKLQETYDNNVIAVVVIDTWSLRVKRYFDIVMKCDSVSYNNCVVLVVWNGDDQEVKKNKLLLEQMLEVAFPTKTKSPDQTFFVNPISTKAELCERLESAIVNTYKRILEYGEKKRAVESGALLTRLQATENRIDA
jgi:FxsC-like protein